MIKKLGVRCCFYRSGGDASVFESLCRALRLSLLCLLILYVSSSQIVLGFYAPRLATQIGIRFVSGSLRWQKTANSYEEWIRNTLSSDCVLHGINNVCLASMLPVEHEVSGLKVHNHLIE